MSNKKPSILLVEDEPNLINLYNVVLKRYFTVFVVETYDEAEKFLVDNKPDLILLDIIIPVKKGSHLDYSQKVGFDVLKKAKGIPAIVLTNLDSHKDRKMAEDLGALEFVVKANILPKDLVAKIAKVLKVKID